MNIDYSRANRPCVRTGLFLFVLAVSFSAATTFGQTVTMTMDDLGQTPVDGLMHPNGVEFGFSIAGQPSTEANYGSGGPGMTQFVDDPSIEGSTDGVLRIDFPHPTALVEFGIALLGGGTIADAVDVKLLSSSGSSLFADGLDFETITAFTEAQFVYLGDPVSSAVVDFTPAATMDPALPRFAFDNLTFRVPEPSAAILLSAVVIFMLGKRRHCEHAHGV